MMELCSSVCGPLRMSSACSSGVRETDPPKNWTEYPDEQLGGPDKELIRKTESAEVKVSLKPRSGKHLAKYTLTADMRNQLS